MRKATFDKFSGDDQQTGLQKYHSTVKGKNSNDLKMLKQMTSVDIDIDTRKLKKSDMMIESASIEPIVHDLYPVKEKLKSTANAFESTSSFQNEIKNFDKKIDLCQNNDSKTIKNDNVLNSENVFLSNTNKKDPLIMQSLKKNESKFTLTPYELLKNSKKSKKSADLINSKRLKLQEEFIKQQEKQDMDAINFLDIELKKLDNSKSNQQVNKVQSRNSVDVITPVFCKKTFKDLAGIDYAIQKFQKLIPFFKDKQAISQFKISVSKGFILFF